MKSAMCRMVYLVLAVFSSVSLPAIQITAARQYLESGLGAIGLGQFQAAERHLQKALEIAEQDGDAEVTLASLSALADVYRGRGQAHRAEQSLVKAIHILREKFGAHHTRLASLLAQMATAQEDRGFHSSAESHINRAVALYALAPAGSRNDMANALETLASFYRTRNEQSRAEELYRKILQIKEEIFAPSSTEVLLAIRNLAFLYQNQARYPEAISLFAREVEILEHAPERRAEMIGSREGSSLLIPALDNLIRVQKKAKKYSAAEASYLRKLEILRKQLRNMDLAYALQELGDFYRIQSRFRLAVPRLKEAWKLADRMLLKNDPVRASFLNSLGIVYHLQANFGEAEKYYKQALDLRLKLLAPDSEYTAVSLGNLASLYYSAHDNVRAETLVRQAIAVWERSGDQGVGLASALEAYNSILLRTGRLNEAMALQKRLDLIRVLDGDESLLPRDARLSESLSLTPENHHQRQSVSLD